MLPRQLYYFDETNQKRTVSVFVGGPQPVADSSDNECPFQLIGIDNQQTHSARGRDSMQALQSALIAFCMMSYGDDPGFVPAHVEYLTLENQQPRESMKKRKPRRFSDS